MANLKLHLSRLLRAGLGRLRAAYAATAVIVVVVERVARSVPPVLRDEKWAADPLTPYVITAVNALLIVGLMALGICIAVIVVDLIVRCSRPP